MINQSKYIGYLLKIFHMNDCKAAYFPFLSGIKLEEVGSTTLVDSTLYRQRIVNLLYLTHSRPYLSYVVSVIVMFMHEPHELLWKATKHILHYVQGMREFRVHYYVGAQLDMIGFIDSDWDGDSIENTSTIGFVFMFGFVPICCSSKKQAYISISSIKAEYRGAVNTVI